MPAESVLLVAIAIFTTLFSYTVVYKNIQLSLQRAYALAMTFSVAWYIGDAMMLGARSDPEISIGKLLFSIAPIFLTWQLLRFTFQVTKTPLPMIFEWILAIYTVGISTYILIYNPLFDTFSINYGSQNTFTVDRFQYTLYGLSSLPYFLLSYALIIRRIFKSSGRERSFSKNLFWAIFISSAGASVTNLLLPTLGISSLVWLGPIFTPAFVVAAGYASSRNKLYEIRLFILRTATYILCILLIAPLAEVLLYALIGRQLFSFDSTEFSMALIFFLLGVILLIIEKRIRELLERLFIQDSYDTDRALGTFSSVAVAEYQIEALANKSIELIATLLRPRFLHLILINSYTHSSSTFTFGDSNAIDVDSLKHLLTSQPERAFYVDFWMKNYQNDTQDIQPEDTFAQSLLAHGIYASVQLASKDDVIGYLVLGEKTNYSPYTSQDAKFLQVATNELAVATQNALRFAEIKQFNERLSNEVHNATSELQQTNRKLQTAVSEIDTSKRRLEKIVSSIDEAIFGLDGKGKITFVNASAQSILNIHDNPVGKELCKIINMETKSGEIVDTETLLSASPGGVSEQNLTINYGESDRVIVDVIVREVGAASASDAGYVVAMHDVTEQATVQEERHSYIALLSHELRTPLTYLEGMLSNLQDTIQDKQDDTLLKSMSGTHDQVVNINSILNQLTSYLTADSKRVGVPTQEIDIASIVSQVSESYRSDAEQKGIELSVVETINSQRNTIRSNEMYVRNILTVLIDNAVKFTDEGHVIVRLNQDDHAIQISVIDTGAGISKHNQLSIFKLGKQVEDFHTRTKGGLGLSLYTASKLAKQLGATLKVESEVGSGSTFIFTIPTD